jgi:hypothetical protein
MADVQLEKPVAIRSSKKRFLRIPSPSLYAIYALALAVSVYIWLIALRSPLWLDETGTYWQISDGFSQIWSRQYLSFPAYNYILWLSTKIIGTSELALRIPSILAMLGAVWLLYRIAREFFDRETALIAIIIFCVDPIVIFTSIDARPYAFAMLATNAAIYILLRLRRNNSNWLAALFGFTAACIIYFHYLFAAILPALLLCFWLLKARDRKTFWRQLAIALSVFALACLPVISGMEYVFRTGSTHVCERVPDLLDLGTTLAPGWLPFVLVLMAVVALIIVALKTPREHSLKPFRSLSQSDRLHILLIASLALIPILLLYGISSTTPIQIFAARHRLVGVPGIALCWALIVTTLFRSRARLVLCIALVAATAFTHLHTPDLREHDPTWKYALAFAESNASRHNNPVLVCSPFVEGAYLPMPTDSPKKSGLFSPLSYYKLSVPVIAMPYALNSEALRIGSQFLASEDRKHERFLALADTNSYKVLDWVAQSASGKYLVHNLGVFDGVEVLEFTPSSHANFLPEIPPPGIP